MNNLPTVSDKRLAVRVTRDALRQIRGGSPWIYDGSIESVSHQGAPGDLAVIFDDKRKFAAIGLWDPTSPIQIKVLHVGSPTQVDERFWMQRCADALERRDHLVVDDDTTAYRWVHGENDRLPGLIVDRYAETVVVKLYSPGWWPHLSTIVDVLQTVAVQVGRPIERVVLRLSRSVAKGDTFGMSDGDTLVGEAPTRPVKFRERGLVLEADVVAGQKTGHFLDQRDNRALVRSMAAGADVLDVFASTGGFALSAAAGGAKSVHMIDQSGPALNTASRNFSLNQHLPEVRRCHVHSTVADAFEQMILLGQREERFDLIVVDPPSFASNQAAVDRALASYGRLARLAASLVRRGGTLVQASCSARVPADRFAETVVQAAGSAGVDLHIQRRTGHAVDHPVGHEYGEYLKAVYLKVR